MGGGLPHPTVLPASLRLRTQRPSDASTWPRVLPGSRETWTDALSTCTRLQASLPGRSPKPKQSSGAAEQTLSPEASRVTAPHPGLSVRWCWRASPHLPEGPT